MDLPSINTDPSPHPQNNSPQTESPNDTAGSTMRPICHLFHFPSNRSTSALTLRSCSSSIAFTGPSISKSMSFVGKMVTISYQTLCTPTRMAAAKYFHRLAISGSGCW